jgi:hypothetical protein
MAVNLAGGLCEVSNQSYRCRELHKVLDTLHTREGLEYLNYAHASVCVKVVSRKGPLKLVKRLARLCAKKCDH